MNTEMVTRHCIIGDEQINDGDLQAIITPLWWSVSIYDGETEMYDALEQFSEQQRYVWAIQWYYTEVENGGHEQFFCNYSGIVWELALEGLKAMKCTRFEEILSEAVVRIGGYPSADREQRWREMDRHNAEFDDLDRDFYNYDTALQEAMRDYVRANRAEFYFDGEVDVPADYVLDEDDTDE